MRLGGLEGSLRLIVLPPNALSFIRRKGDCFVISHGVPIVIELVVAFSLPSGFGPATDTVTASETNEKRS